MRRQRKAKKRLADPDTAKREREKLIYFFRAKMGPIPFGDLEKLREAWNKDVTEAGMSFLKIGRSTAYGMEFDEDY